MPKRLKTTIYILLMAFLLGACTSSEDHKQEAPASIQTAPVATPLLKSNNQELDTLSAVFHMAIGDVFSNIRMRHTAAKGQEKPILFAGFDYTGAWTRDAAINVWSGAGLLYPDVARNTLLEILKTDPKGDTLIGGQYWDKMIWTIGAWNLYLFHGDKSFLRTAYQASLRTLALLENEEFDPEKGLFRGGAVYGDGIAAYDDLYTQTGAYREDGLWLSNIDKWPEANPEKKARTGWGLPMMTLSTNCMYAEVYRILPKMAAELGLKPSEDHSKMQQALRTAIQKWFWDPQRQAFAYYIDPWKTCAAQEGLGLSFALLFGIADTLQSDQTLKHATTEPAGMPCVYPSFSRYTDARGQHYGRHSGTVWTHVQGFWAHAAAINGNLDRFDHEFRNLTLHTLRDMQFREIYHPKTGQAYGGMQEDGFKKGWIREWKSTERQTWGATAYLRMVLNGLFGMNFSEQGIGFKPVVPRAYENLRLTGIPYQGAVLNFYIQGWGTQIKQFRVNGKRGPAMIPRDIRGNVVVEMELE